jgi:hypothetical protein
MTMRRVLMIAMLTALTGCVNLLAERRAELAHWVGQPETALVGAMGAPTRTYETGGMKFLTYEDRRVEIIPGTPYYFGSGMAAGSRPRPSPRSATPPSPSPAAWCGHSACAAMPAGNC